MTMTMTMTITMTMTMTMMLMMMVMIIAVTKSIYEWFQGLYNDKDDDNDTRRDQAH